MPKRIDADSRPCNGDDSARHWLELEGIATRVVQSELERWGGRLPSDALADLASEARTKAFEQCPHDHEQAKVAVATFAKSAVRQAKREAARQQTGLDAAIQGARQGDTAFSARRRALLKLPREKARALAAALEHYEKRELRYALESGSIHRGSWLRERPAEVSPARLAMAKRADWFERCLYRNLLADIAKHSGRNIDAECIVEQLVAFRETHILVRCEQCAPGSRWIECHHSVPRFERGEQVDGADLRARGKRKPRFERRMKFGGGSSEQFDAMPYANYNATYQVEDAAGRLVAEVLRLCGVDPDVRHTLSRQRARDEMRKIHDFLKGWEPGPDGELREKPAKPIPPGRARKRKTA